MSVNVVLADDENLIRKLFISELSRYSDVRVVGQASNGEELMMELSKSKPHVVLLDIVMPGMSGIELLIKIKALDQQIKVIIISMLDTDDVILRAYREGAVGYLCKKEDVEVMYKAIKTVSRGDIFFTQRIAKLVLNNAVYNNVEHKEHTEKIKFTKKEIAIIRYLNEGSTSSEIAKKIYRSESTVNRIRQELIHRVGAKNTHGLLVFCAAQGFFDT